MKTAFPILLFALTVLSSCNQTPSNESKRTYGGFLLPEGAVISGDYVYISNVGKEFKPLDKDGDGFIFRMKKDGSQLELNFIPANDTLHSPKGMAVIKNTLYVTDIDRILGFDLTSGKRIFTLNFSSEKTSLLNDLTAKSETALFVSAMDIGKIYEVRIDSPSYKEVYAMPKPNGLFWQESQNTLYVGQFGREDNANGDKGDIGKLTFKNDSVVYTSLGIYQGNIDGVEVYNDTLFFTNWLSHGENKGSLHALDLKTGTISEVEKLEINGAGDFTYDASTRTFFIPKMRENKLLILKKK